MIAFRFFSTHEHLSNAVKQELIDHIKKPGALMLSGGSTPYQIYGTLKKEEVTLHPERTFFLSDERYVEAHSPLNNGHNLLPMLEELQAMHQFIPVQTSLPLEKAARVYEEHLLSFDNLDLGLLGIGTDGHTAGLFTIEQATEQNTCVSCAMPRPDQLDGISVSASFIQRVERIILIATGESKRAILKELRENPTAIPAGRILQAHPNAAVWTDLSEKDLC